MTMTPQFFLMTISIYANTGMIQYTMSIRFIFKRLLKKIQRPKEKVKAMSKLIFSVTIQGIFLCGVHVPDVLNRWSVDDGLIAPSPLRKTRPQRDPRKVSLPPPTVLYSLRYSLLCGNQLVPGVPCTYTPIGRICGREREEGGGGWGRGEKTQGLTCFPKKICCLSIPL